MWYYCSQSSEHIALCFQVTALLQAPHGNFGGPGLGSGAYEFARSRLHKYVSTNLSCLMDLFFFMQQLREKDRYLKSYSLCLQLLLTRCCLELYYYCGY